VESLQVELFVGLDGNEPHVLPGHGPGDGLGVKKSFLFALRNGFTNCAGISRTSCPSPRNAAPTKCAPEQASMPINDDGRFAV
jgi:hypothetical protein